MTVAWSECMYTLYVCVVGGVKEWKWIKPLDVNFNTLADLNLPDTNIPLCVHHTVAIVI
jgi:hypothetical protein